MQIQRAQNAIEFLTTYGFVILIISIMLSLLLIFSVIPKSTLPLQCSFYSGFNCVDAAYYNTSAGSQFVIVGTDMQPGIINISAFSAYIDYAQSQSGYCLPTIIASGQSFYCVANFSITPTTGNLYGGTFKLTAMYCANSPSSLSARNCTNTMAITYGGAMQLQSTAYNPTFFINLPYPPDIYCVGSRAGSSTQAYYTHISSAGVGNWIATNSYPIQFEDAGCSIYSDYIYCVGSLSGSQNKAYYSQVTSNGIGIWKSTTTYPAPINFAGCSTYKGYIYCIGGSGATEQNTYYAPVSSNGIGNWVAAGSYPVSLSNAGCSAYNGYIYCVGTNSGTQNQVYYAPILNPGIGTWTATTNYPTLFYKAGCSIYEGYIYCVGNASGSENGVYYAPVSSAGVGNWIAAMPYPVQLSLAGCSVFEGYIYCVGSNSGTTNQVYYAPILNPGIGSWTSSNSYPVTDMQLAYCSVPGSSGGYLGGGGGSS